jgi:hypothetical protein
MKKFPFAQIAQIFPFGRKLKKTHHMNITHSPFLPIALVENG